MNTYLITLSRNTHPQLGNPTAPLNYGKRRCSYLHAPGSIDERLGDLYQTVFCHLAHTD